MPITLKDIAKMANVSHMTVSRVVNGSQNVSEETRERVERIIQETNYTPSETARALISGKTNTIGVLVMYDLRRFPQDFLPALLEGISFSLYERGYGCTLLFDQVNGKKSVISKRMLQKGQIDGLLIISVERDAAIRKRVQDTDVPVVLVNQRIQEEEVGYVVADEVRGSCEAVTYLLQNGHRHIGYLGGTPVFSTSEERLEGYKNALETYGVPFNGALCRVGDFDNQKSYEQVLGLLGEHPEVTAIFAANDAMALGAYRAAAELGLAIPQDLSVVGYDNQEYCQYIQPPLTTVSKHRRTMGEKAASLIVEAIESKKSPGKVVLRPELKVRSSVRKMDE